jgi:hypothetical protein
VVTVEKNGNGQATGVKTKYHLTEPTRLTMTQRRELVGRVSDLLEQVKDTSGCDDVTYLTMFPRHVTRCCGREGHMTEGDCLTTTSVRLDVDRDVREELRDRQTGIRVLEWWRLTKQTGELGVREIAEKGILSSDGVHLTTCMNKTAALYLCRRMLETGNDGWSDSESVSSSKRPRLELN